MDDQVQRQARFFWARICIKLGHRLGPWLQNFPASFLTADQLIELMRWYYRQPHVVEAWAKNASGGLISSERFFLKKYASAESRVLILGAGTGREALVLAGQGMDVTAVDQSPAMLEILKRTSRDKRLKIETVEDDYLNYMPERKPFDIIFLGINYGCIPTRQRRVSFLNKMRSWLTAEGRVYITFLSRPWTIWEQAGFWFRRFLAIISVGNPGVQRGDEIRGEGEFVHHFRSTPDILQELKEAGFDLDGSVDTEHALFIKAAGGS